MIEKLKEAFFRKDFDKAIDNAKRNYQRNGFAIIRKVFSIDEISQLRRAAVFTLTQVSDINKAGYKHLVLDKVNHDGVESPALVFWPALVNSTMLKFRNDVRLQRIVKYFLGDNVKQLNNQFYYRLPGDLDSFSWHQDIMFRSPLSEYPNIVEENGYLQTAIIVDKSSAKNSSVIYVKGSHQFGNLELHENGNYSRLRGFRKNDLPKLISHLPKISLSLNPGDLVVWSALTVHGSCPNPSGRNSRMYLMNGFAKANNCKRWPWYLRNSAIQEINSNLIP